MANVEQAPAIVFAETVDRAGIEILDSGVFFYLLDGQRVQWTHAKAEVADGRRIDTRTAKALPIERGEVRDALGRAVMIRAAYQENGLRLERRFFLYENSAAVVVQASLSDDTGTVCTRYIAPIDTPYPDRSGKPLFLSLNQRMLFVPYDNDMWVRYEAAPMGPGKTSYDVTAIFDEDTREGLVLGALDHAVWKNAIACSGFDARCVVAYSGAADLATHDTVPHGTLEGESVESARFVMEWTEDIRAGLERYGALCAKVHAPVHWAGAVPFGFNTFSGLGGGFTLDAWQEAGDFLQNELDNFQDADGATYINLDGHFGLDMERVQRMVDAFHARGQKVGTYSAPCVGHVRLGLDRPLLGESGYTMRDLLLKDDKGRPLPAADSLLPLDVTHPGWETHVRASLLRVVEMGFDYLKIDFLSHGAMEGAHYDAACRTGRMALQRAYDVIWSELDRSEKPIFVSLSIAPLFPAGYGHARRCCCDSFGHIEDVQYILNALNFGWWENRTLYHYNDPDHVVLYNSVIDGRGPTLLAEARSRYHAAVISGTVMLLSDNYGPGGDETLVRESRERGLLLARNPRLNALARLGVAFTPVELRAGTTGVYTLAHEGRQYVAAFNFAREPAIASVKATRAGLPLKGIAEDITRGVSWAYDSILAIALEPMDSAIVEITPKVGT